MPALIFALALASFVAGCGVSETSGAALSTPTHTPTAPPITEFPLARPDAVPSSLTIGPDGNVWFVEVGISGQNGRIGRMTAEGTVTEFALPTAGAYPTAIINGPDGALWFTEPTAIGRITTAGTISEYHVKGQTLPGLAVGPDHALWFAELPAGDLTRAPGRLGRITLDGVVSERPLEAAGIWATAITTGPDGAIWFAEANVAGGNSAGGLAVKLGRVSSSGTITELPLPATAGIVRHMTAGPNGNVWFTQDPNGSDDKQASGTVGRMTPTGAVSDVAILTGNGPLNCITSGADNSLWVCGRGLLHLSVAGAVNVVALPTADNAVISIVSTSQGPVWFAEAAASGPGATGNAHGKLGRLG